jgi:hypothetical protein
MARLLIAARPGRPYGPTLFASVPAGPPGFVWLNPDSFGSFDNTRKSRGKAAGFRIPVLCLKMKIEHTSKKSAGTNLSVGARSRASDLL